jgi:predicted transcriptional regulator YdeE/DNA-binding transcriptional MerR regulator
MLRVGEFSQLAHVTVKTLRHYDRLGLLKPVWTDRYTGYRYYNLDQLPRLHRILALKDLGFSLAQVGKMINEDLPVGDLRRMFDQKQAELQQHLVTEQERLRRVAQRLEQIEQHGGLPSHEITLKAVPELSVTSLRAVIPETSTLEAELNRMRTALQSWTITAGLRSRGQWLLIYHHPEYRERQLDLEVALLVDDPDLAEARSQVRTKTRPPGDGSNREMVNEKLVQARSSIQLRRLPAVDEMACLLSQVDASQDKPISATQNLAMLYAWVEASQYTVVGSLRELQLSDPVMVTGQRGIILPTQYIETQLPVESLFARKTRILNRLNRKEEEMQPEIVELPEFIVVGMRYYGKNENQEISELWGEFNARANEIKHVAPDSPAYGVCITVPDAPSGEFEYVASFRVENDRQADMPEGMVSRKIPAHKYAVFTHVGSLEKLSQTYHYIYQVWIPQSGYHPAGIDFELYDQDFKDFTPDSKFYIYVPID